MLVRVTMARRDCWQKLSCSSRLCNTHHTDFRTCRGASVWFIVHAGVTDVPLQVAANKHFRDKFSQAGDGGRSEGSQPGQCEMCESRVELK